MKQAPEIGSRLQSLRKAQGLSLEDMAMKSKISRSMLSQVERGLANPTFATLWALTQALRIDIADLIGQEQGAAPQAIERIEGHNIPIISSADGKSRLKILSPPDTTGAIEWYELEIDPGARLSSQAHAQGCREHLSIHEGEVVVTSGEVSEQGHAGSTLRYAADLPHMIHNSGKTLMRGLLVVLSVP